MYHVEGVLKEAQHWEARAGKVLLHGQRSTPASIDGYLGRESAKRGRKESAKPSKVRLRDLKSLSKQAQVVAQCLFDLDHV